jgi:hypothetical protein
MYTLAPRSANGFGNRIEFIQAVTAIALPEPVDVRREESIARISYGQKAAAEHRHASTQVGDDDDGGSGHLDAALARIGTLSDRYSR